MYQPLLGRRRPSHIPLSPCLATAPTPTPALSPEPGVPGWLLKNPGKQHVVGSGAGPRGSPACLQPVPGDWEHAGRHDSTPMDATNGKFTLRRPRQHLLPAFGVTVTTTLTVSSGPWWEGPPAALPSNLGCRPSRKLGGGGCLGAAPALFADCSPRRAHRDPPPATSSPPPRATVDKKRPSDTGQAIKGRHFIFKFLWRCYKQWRLKGKKKKHLKILKLPL